MWRPWVCVFVLSVPCLAFSPSSSARGGACRPRNIYRFSTKISPEEDPFHFDGLDEPPTVLPPIEHYLSSTSQAIAYTNERQHFLESLEMWIRLRAIPAWGKLPFKRFVSISLEGELPLYSTQRSGFGSRPPISLDSICQGLLSAAHDPRIDGLFLEISPISIPTAYLQEIRRHMDYMQKAGKELVGFAPTSVTIDQLYLLGGCSARYVSPEAYTSVQGFSVQADFLRGVFDKIGITPQVERIGAYKSFGDRFNRYNMSEAQRETLESILDISSTHKLQQLALDSSHSVEEVEAFLDSGTVTPELLVGFGLLDGLKYEDEVLHEVSSLISKRHPPFWRFLMPWKDEDSKGLCMQSVASAKIPNPRDLFTKLPTYVGKMKPIKMAPGRKGDKTVALLYASGAIVNKKGPSAGADDLVVENFKAMVNQVMNDRKIDAVVVRIASPGGDALSSDLMWRQMQLLKASGKPVVASVTSVAASGGYYIAMGADHIVAEEQSITGSIGVVSAKFNASKLFKKIGYNVERLSRGRYAEVYALERDFTEDERKFWKDLAWHSYKAFVSKAARSRGMRTDAMHRRAQGRVWSGVQGLGLGLVDEIGGLHTAVARAHHMVEARATETRAFKVAAKHTAAEKAQQSGLQGWKFRNFMDVQRFVKLAGGLEAAEVLLPTLPSARELVLQKRQGKGKPRPLKTRVKYIYPPSPNPLAALLSVAGLQAAEEPSQIEFILRQAALSTGRPMALIDDVIGQALPGIGLVPESLRVLGIGPLENQLLGGDVTAILKCLDRLLRP